MSKKYAAVDLGASSGRVIIGDISSEALKLTESHRFDNGPIKSDGSLYWDVEKLINEIKQGLCSICNSGVKIDGVAIDTWGVDYALVNKSTGMLARKPYHYRDSRTNSVPEELFKKIPFSQIYARTGIQFMQLNTIYQLVAHKEKHPEDFRGTVLLMMPDLLTYMLTENMECEYTEASTSQLINAATREWDYELIKRIGLPEEIFPRIVQPCTGVGIIRKEIAGKIGCNELKVYKIGSHDTASAVAAVPASEAGNWAYLSCGTWSLLGAEIDSPIITDQARISSFTNEGGLNGKIRFLSNIMGLWLIQECRRIWSEGGRKYSFMEIAEMASKVSIGKYIINPNSARFLAPEDMASEIIKYCEETSQGKPGNDGEVARCVFDSLALCYRAKLEDLNIILGRIASKLHVVGGGCKNTLLMRCACDCCGIPVVIGPVEATAIGNLLGQGIASGVIKSLAAGRELVKNSFPVEEITPDNSSRKTWDKLYEKYRKLPV